MEINMLAYIPPIQMRTLRSVTRFCLFIIKLYIKFSTGEITIGKFISIVLGHASI